jgi:hypothetical protein
LRVYSKYYLKQEQQCFVRYETRGDCLMYDKAQTTSVSNGLKNDPSYESIDEVILKVKVV